MVFIAEFDFISPSPSELIPAWIFHLIILVGGFFIIIDRFVLPLRDLYQEFRDLIKRWIVWGRHRDMPLEVGGAALRQAQALRLEASHSGFPIAKWEAEFQLHISPSKIRNSKSAIRNFPPYAPCPMPYAQFSIWSLPLIRLLLRLQDSIFSWKILNGHYTLPEGIASNGFNDRRNLSFVLTVYSIRHSFATQTEQSGRSIIRNSSFNRNCTVLHARPSTWLYGCFSWVSRNHSSLLPRANVERDSARSKRN